MGAAKPFGKNQDKPPRRRWGRLAVRGLRLLISQADDTSDLVRRSYDGIAGDYDHVWTDHMRDLSLMMLDRLAVGDGAECIDLACGTGFLTGELARRAGTRATGVDASAGMLAVARRRHGQCDFVQSDAVAYLRARPADSADVVTCGWGLGYTRPLAVVRQVGRVLRPGGMVGIIDNRLFSLAEVLWAAALTFAERPEALRHVMKVRFLPSSGLLGMLMRACGLSVEWRTDGSKTYHVADGPAAVERLTATGAAAGFEFATDPESRRPIFDRFAQILQRRSGGPDGVPITHRYLAAVGRKRC